jgi:hypothetical protein
VAWDGVLSASRGRESSDRRFREIPQIPGERDQLVVISFCSTIGRAIKNPFAAERVAVVKAERELI